jgi:hypothetical protein
MKRVRRAKAVLRAERVPAGSREIAAEADRVVPAAVAGMAVAAGTADAMAGAAAKAAADGTGSRMKITGNPRGNLANHAGRFDSQLILRVVRFAEPELATL